MDESTVVPDVKPLDSALDVLLLEYDRLVVAFAYRLELRVRRPKDVRLAARAELNDLRARAEQAERELDTARRMGELAEARLRVLAEAMEQVIDKTCSYICPSTGRAGHPIPHDPRCERLHAALRAARGEGSRETND